jgi:hypothetical protein
MKGALPQAVLTDSLVLNITQTPTERPYFVFEAGADFGIRSVYLPIRKAGKEHSLLSLPGGVLV